MEYLLAGLHCVLAPGTGKRKKDKKKLEDLAEEMDLLKEMDNVVNVRGWEGNRTDARVYI